MFLAARREPVLPFAELGREDVALAGGKGAGLGELCRAGARVPPGFVITTEAFQAFAGGLVEDAIARIARLRAAGHDELERACGQLRAALLDRQFPNELAEAVRSGYAELAAAAPVAADPPVAVRSSATAEDSAEASFAGLQDTYLWVRGEDEVLQYVRRCWASLYSVESVAYRLRRGLAEDGLGIAVVVQQMVDARSSGVVFTRSPVTGDRSAVAVEASWGLGSAVVGGEVTPDSWMLNKVTGEVLRRTVSAKRIRHVMDPSGHGVLAEEVPAELREVPALTDAELRLLVTTGRAIERHYGCPQDIEWAWAAGQDEPFVLQSRPETVWSNRDRAPLATPAAQPFEHVLALLGGSARPRPGRPDGG